MKNLKLWKDLSTKIQLQSDGENLLFSAFDVEQNRVFFASSDNFLYSVSLYESQEEERWSKAPLSSDGYSLTEPGDHITAIEYLMEKEAVIMGTSNGYLVLHIVDCDITEVVGKVEGGIKTISCSPDGALLAVIAGLGQLLVMTHDWEVLYEIALEPCLLDDADGDNIEPTGYQFASNISWRGDGKYFATLSGPSELNSLKKLKMWERDSGALHASTESHAFIGECLAWMPSGAKVAVAQEKTATSGPSIVFFEKNGLERSYFSTETVKGTVMEALKWNCSSDLLAASFHCDGYDAITIWSFSNHHWYLKHEIRYPKKERVKFEWDSRQSLQLICWTTNGEIKLYKFAWLTAVRETSKAFVIDGSKVLVSPLDMSFIPPPLSLFRLKFPAAVNEIAYLFTNSKSYLAACLSDGCLCIAEFPATDTWDQFEDKELIVETSTSDIPVGTLRQLTWLDSNLLVGVCHCVNNESGSIEHSTLRENTNNCKNRIGWSNGSFLQQIEIECNENCVPDVTSSGWRIKNLKQVPLEGFVIGIVLNPAKKSSLFLQFEGGSVLEFTCLNSFDDPPAPSFQNLGPERGFSSSCPWMNSALISDNDTLSPLIIGLDESGRLQIGQKILCNNCSSYSLYSDTSGLTQMVVTHLIFTTIQDLLFVISMSDILHGNPQFQIEFNTRGSTSNRKGENKDFLRIWERGAKVVGVIHGDESAVILQAVRGNLECIYPRKLVTTAVANSLSQFRFKDAVLIVRRHRIDFNIIVDYFGLQRFLKYSMEFVRQVNNIGYITEFICAIKNENVMDTLYKTSFSLPILTAPTSLHVTIPDNSEPDKVSLVLLAIRKAVEECMTESPARELCILTTMARSDPPALEEALKRIKVIREQELSGTDEECGKSYPSAEEALKHLLWLSNADAVYDAALGLYDLHLAAIVALNSDKDPKEFIPFLQELEQMSPDVMKYKIDLRLHRYESALRHIASAGDDYFEDCMTLMKDNPDLFLIGLELFADRDKRYLVLETWGDHLYDEKKYEDAATTFLCCSSSQKALKSYHACGDWRGMLTVAGLLNLPKDEVLQIAVDLCDELQALGKAAEAGKIALEYCLDVPTGVGYYITAREWQEALRISYLHKREDLINKVENAAVECASALVHEYEDGLEKVGKYVARYLAVRQRRIFLAAKLQSDDRPASDIDEDTASETSSNFSGMSAYTTGSFKGSSSTSIRSTTASKSKEKRRQRNRGKIRAGSPGEELALFEHLKGMSVSEIAQRELRSLVNALIMLSKFETARKLQHAADIFELTQTAAVKLAETTSSSDQVDESTQSLSYYMEKVRGNFGTRMPFSQTRLLLSH